MKLIIAYVQPERLTDVKRELYRAEVYKVSVTNALGCGQQRGYHKSYRGVDFEVNLLKKVRLEIAVNEDFVPVRSATARFSCSSCTSASASGRARRAARPSGRPRARTAGRQVPANAGLSKTIR